MRYVHKDKENSYVSIKKRTFIILNTIISLFVITIFGSFWAFSGNNSTYSFFFEDHTFNNEIDIAKYKVKLSEYFDSYAWIVGGEYQTLRKEARITNNGTAPVVLRVALAETWTTGGGEILSNTIDGNDVVIKTYATEFMGSDWALKNGWYYYKKILNANQYIDILRAIELNGNVFTVAHPSSEYTDSEYALNVLCDSSQATVSAAKNLFGYEYTVSENTIVWSFES